MELFIHGLKRKSFLLVHIAYIPIASISGSEGHI
uniref:Uncharacterized protein n=1 Tax=Anguilla anguilla TaxID=7936 RepID=A0A0E9SAA5_ANGAN